MAAKCPESSLQHLRTLLGLAPLPTTNSLNFVLQYSSQYPRLRLRQKKSLPFTLTILDLLDISHLSPENILSTHTFTRKLPRCLMTSPASTIPYKGDAESIFATEKDLALTDLLPENRDLILISTGVGIDLQPTLSVVRALGLSSNSKVVGTFDVHGFTQGVASLSPSFSPSIAKLLRRLQSPFEIGVNVTEFVLRTALLLVLENCRNEQRDEIEKTWVHIFKEIEIGIGKRVEKGPLETVRNGVKMVGNVIFKGVRRSKDEIERVRAERAWKREFGLRWSLWMR